MKLVDLRRVETSPIQDYESVLAAGAALADGQGDAHVYYVRLEPGGSIGRHEAGFGQLFLVLQGSGWAEGGDGRRTPLSAGEGVWISRGEQHAKGSDTGMTALILQVRDLEPRPGGGSTAPGAGAC